MRLFDLDPNPSFLGKRGNWFGAGKLMFCLCATHTHTSQVTLHVSQAGLCSNMWVCWGVCCAESYQLVKKEKPILRSHVTTHTHVCNHSPRQKLPCLRGEMGTWDPFLLTRIRKLDEPTRQLLLHNMFHSAE